METNPGCAAASASSAAPVAPRPALPDIDPALLSSKQLDTAIVTITSNCNLRCTYCAVSQPTYVGQDADMGKLGGLVDELARYGVGVVQVNGHGETSIVPGWEEFCIALAERDLAVQVTSNFAKSFSEREIEALARMRYIIVSIDTVDRDLLRKIRRAVKLETIIYNMVRVRAAGMAIGRIPMFVWQCTLSDAVAPLLDQFVLFGLAAGVKKFTFGNLIEFQPVPGAFNVSHPAKMPTEQLIAFRDQFKRLLTAMAQNGVSHDVQPGVMEGIEEALRARGVTAADAQPAGGVS